MALLAGDPQEERSAESHLKRQHAYGTSICWRQYLSPSLSNQDRWSWSRKLIGVLKQSLQYQREAVLYGTDQKSRVASIDRHTRGIVIEQQNPRMFIVLRDLDKTLSGNIEEVS